MVKQKARAGKPVGLAASGLAASLAPALLVQGLSRRDRLLAYVRICADRLGLKDWDITLGRGEPANPDSTYATICAYQTQNAELFVSKLFWRQSPEGQRLTIAHELGHLPLWRCDEVVRVAAGVMDASAGKFLRRSFEPAGEFACEHFARLLAPLLPLPLLSASNRHRNRSMQASPSPTEE